MKIQQAAFIAFLCVCSVLAIIGGQFAVLKHFEARRNAEFTSGILFNPDGTIYNPLDDLCEDAPSLNRSADYDHSQRQSSAERTALIEPTANEIEAPAEPESMPPPSELDGPSLGNSDVPEQLPHVEDAAPIDESQKRRDELTRAIIAHELPNASQEERDVWFDQLKGLDPRMARELLSVRTTLRSDSPGGIAELPQLPLLPEQEIATPGELSPQLVTSPGFRGGSSQSAIPAIESSIAALRIARDVVLNNIANANTTAFRRSRILFEDLAYQQIKVPGQQDINGKLAPAGVAVGFGVQIAGTSLDLTSGQLERTDSKLHVAIVGDGFFQVKDGSQILYTRAGAFTKSADGELVLMSVERGRALEPALAIPNDATEVVISDAGIVSVQQGTSSAMTQVGQIHIVRFMNPDGLIRKGENLFAPSDASGTPLVGKPGAGGCGTLKQGFLETSNVNLEEELAEARRLQSRMQALEQARAIMTDSSIDSAPNARIAETPAH